MAPWVVSDSRLKKQDRKKESKMQKAIGKAEGQERLNMQKEEEKAAAILPN